MSLQGLSCVDLDRFPRANRLAVVDIWAPGCQWCNPVSATLDRLSQRYGEQVSFGKLNADECWERVRGLGIMGLPTVLFFKNGELVDRVVGAFPEEYFEERLQRLL